MHIVDFIFSEAELTSYLKTDFLTSFASLGRCFVEMRGFLKQREGFQSRIVWLDVIGQ